MVSALVIWYLGLMFVGLAALPLTMRLFRHLPDRGLAFARVVGLVLCSLGYWLLVTLGLLHNSRAAVLLVVVLLGAISWTVGLRDRQWLGQQWQKLRGQLLLNEGLFLLVFVVLVMFCAFRPEIAATEKPMEFAFINGILRSGAFPPADPWLAGYGISYYYMGYVMVAFLTLLSGLSSAVTYNLAGATVFALAFVGAFSLLRNMAISRQRNGGSSGIGVGLFGGFMALFMGNLEGVFEIMRSLGLGSPALFAWLDVRNLSATGGSGTWVPSDMWWWWRASRIIHDRNALGQSMEVISEFPFFSLVLGDIHPHVLALPLVMLAMALGLDVLLAPARPPQDESEGGGFAAAATRVLSGRATGWRGDPWLWGVLLGAFGFMNTWDLPVYLGLFLVALGVSQARHATGWRPWLTSWVAQASVIGLLGIVICAPFYMGFRSQAGGVALVTVKTQPQQFLLMFGVFVVALAGYLCSLAATVVHLPTRCAMPGLVLLTAVAGVACVAGCLFLGWWSAALALGLATLAAVVLLAGFRRDALHWDAPDMLVLLLTIGGLLLVASVEFIMLRDSFGTRMNTVFKFYYAGWLLLACASAWGVHDVVGRWRERRWLGRALTALWLVMVATLVLAGSSYTVAATMSRTNGLSGGLSLDGTAYVAEYRPDEQKVIDWLVANAPPEAVLVEAVGGSYTEYGWISAASGIPTLLGWTGHELQWRGSYAIPAEREKAVELIYTSTDADAILQILAAYDVDYVIVGPRERATYTMSDASVMQLAQFLPVAYQAGDHVVLERR